MKHCEHCKRVLTSRQEKDGLRFCSRACSNSAIPRIRTAESRSKVAATVSRVGKRLPRNEIGQIRRKCSICSTLFYVDVAYRQRKTCSSQCLNSIRKQNAIRGAQTKTRKGTHSGWHNRRFEPSYAERYFIDLFEKENIVGWEREKKIGRWFIDFAFTERMLALEIDGRQHEDGVRKEQDQKKDRFLSDCGWTVVRIRWTNPKTRSGAKQLHDQLPALFERIT